VFELFSIAATNVLPTQRPPVLTPPSYEVNSKVSETTQITGKAVFLLSKWNKISHIYFLNTKIECLFNQIM